MTRRHSLNDSSEDVGEDVGVGVVECGLNVGSDVRPLLFYTRRVRIDFVRFITLKGKASSICYHTSSATLFLE